MVPLLQITQPRNSKAGVQVCATATEAKDHAAKDHGFARLFVRV
jgi:hypothetical protein